MSIHQRLIFGYPSVAPTPTDPNFSEVKLLLHMNGANASTTFTDSSGVGATMNVGGSAQISTAQSQFGGASGLFNGTTGYVYTPTSSNYGIGNSDFTIEGWKRSAALGAVNRCLVDMREGGTGIAIYASASGSGEDDRLILANNSAVAAGPGTTQFTANTWQHWAVTRSGSTVRGFIAGTLVWSVTDSRTYAASTNFYLGSVYGGGSQFFPGYLDEVRLTIGTARYTANFTPDTSAFPDS